MAAGGGPPDDLVAEFTDAIACRRLHAARVHNTDRILTTHVGSLVRPPELVASCGRAGTAGRRRPDRYADVLRRSVVEVVRQQADAGIDIVSDGEFGKAISWSRYILERLGGFERPADRRLRPAPIRPRRDMIEFPEFYAEYMATQGFAARGRKRHRRAPARSRTRARPSCSATSTTSRPRWPRSTRRRVPARRRAGERRVPGGRTSTTTSEEEYVYAVADALRVGVQGDPRRGADPAGRRRVPAMTYDLMVPPATLEEYRALGRSCASTR